MKKISRSFAIACVCLCLFANQLNGQAVVYDPGAFGQRMKDMITKTIHQATNLAQFVSQVQESVKIFNQAKEYYDHLKSVATTVQKYEKVGDCVSLVFQTGQAYVNAYSKFRMDPNFRLSEVESIGRGYTKLIAESNRIFKKIDLGVLASDMSMTDKERIEIIEEVYRELQGHYNLVVYFTRKMTCISYIRSKEKNNTDVIAKLYGLNKKASN